MDSFKEYQILAGVTRKPDEQPLELAHYALGMVGEAGEIGSRQKMSAEAWIKELGDCFWYAAAVCSVQGYDLETIITIDVPRLSANHTMSCVLTTLLISASSVCEVSKKFLFYGKAPDEAYLRSYVVEYLSCLLFLCRVGGYPPMEVCAKNIAKLETRFGGKFDAFRALNRDVAAEDIAVGKVSQ